MKYLVKQRMTREAEKREQNNTGETRTANCFRVAFIVFHVTVVTPRLDCSFCVSLLPLFPNVFTAVCAPLLAEMINDCRVREETDTNSISDKISEKSEHNKTISIVNGVSPIETDSIESSIEYRTQWLW